MAKQTMQLANKEDCEELLEEIEALKTELANLKETSSGEWTLLGSYKSNITNNVITLPKCSELFLVAGSSHTYFPLSTMSVGASREFIGNSTEAYSQVTIGNNDGVYTLKIVRICGERVPYTSANTTNRSTMHVYYR